MKLYVSDLSVIVLVVFYLPLVIWVLRKLWKSNLRSATKIPALIGTLIVAYLIPLGDVTYNSLAMAKVCPSAGLHIYKTVEVEGYIDSGGESTLKESLYKFVEAPQMEVGGSYHWNRYEKQLDGSISRVQLDEPTATYEVLMGNGYAKFNGFSLPGYSQETHTEKDRWVIRNRVTGEILAEWLFFRALPGWLDSVLMYRWFGSGGETLSCDANYDFSGWREKVLLPKKSTNS